MPVKNVTITLPTEEELALPDFRERLKESVWNRGVGQREWPTEISDAFMKADWYGARYRHADGTPFPVPDIDDVWMSERFIRTFLQSEGPTEYEKEVLVALYFSTVANLGSLDYIR